VKNERKKKIYTRNVDVFENDNISLRKRCKSRNYPNKDLVGVFLLIDRDKKHMMLSVSFILYRSK